MEEINRNYGKESAAPSSSSASKPKVAVKVKARREEEKEDTFETGFDHGFETMSTFNGKSVGNEGGPTMSSSVNDKDKQVTNTF